MVILIDAYEIVRLEDKMDDNKKLKVYLDTSVISYLMQTDAPERMVKTLQLWEKFKKGAFDVCLSQVTLTEISKCDLVKFNFLLEKLAEIEYITYELNDEVYKLANEVIEKGILTEKSFDDCTHIAAAIVNNCDVIISWNFKHMVNIKTIKGIRIITNLKGYNSIEIMTPEILLEMEV